MLAHWHQERKAVAGEDRPAMVSASDTEGVKGVLSKFKKPRKAK